MIFRATVILLALTPVLAAAGETTPAAVPSPVLPVPPAAEKVICRSSVDTGSLVHKTKRCFTQSQWRFINEGNETESRRLIDDNRSRNTGNN